MKRYDVTFYTVYMILTCVVYIFHLAQHANFLRTRKSNIGPLADDKLSEGWIENNVLNI
jgi:hypothetical protein